MPRRTDRLSYLWLYIGVVSISTVLGYMVGASNTPVVGAAIPSVFGLLVIAIGALWGRRPCQQVRKATRATKTELALSPCLLAL